MVTSSRERGASGKAKEERREGRKKRGVTGENKGGKGEERDGKAMTDVLTISAPDFLTMHETAKG